MTLNVFIQGSCVTRDAFDFSKDSCFKIEHYGARSSFATMTMNPIESQFDLSQIKSPFQKRMLEDDHNRSALKHLSEKNYDVLRFD